MAGGGLCNNARPQRVFEAHKIDLTVGIVVDHVHGVVAEQNVSVDPKGPFVMSEKAWQVCLDIARHAPRVSVFVVAIYAVPAFKMGEHLVREEKEIRVLCPRRIHRQHPVEGAIDGTDYGNRLALGIGETRRCSFLFGRSHRFGSRRDAAHPRPATHHQFDSPLSIFRAIFTHKVSAWCIVPDGSFSLEVGSCLSLTGQGMTLRIPFWIEPDFLIGYDHGPAVS
ncbi:MAG: hypothetical protein CME02_02105 [Geminicoccus sp.]|nr:hypothetical protein [Geminicoccus sp.]